MSRSREMGCRMVGSVAGAIAVLVWTSAAVHAAPQSHDQQRCLNEMNRRGSDVAREQGKVAYTCLRDAAHGNTEKLGNPPQPQTAQACPSNDVKGKIAKRQALLAARDLDRCLASPELRPGFGYTGASATGAAATAAGIGLVADLFGPDLDAAVVLEDGDKDAAKCQAEVLKRVQRVFEDTWKEALRQKKDVLDGDGRLTGSVPDAPVAAAGDLLAEITTYVQSDPRGKIAKAVAKVIELTQSRCGGVSMPIAQLFPGVCGASPTLSALALCAAERAQGRFFASLGGLDGLAVDCDLTDDGASNLSCESDALRAHVLNRIGYGPDAWSWARIQTLGVVGYIEEQLSPDTIDDSALDAELATRFPSLAMSFTELRTNYPQGGSPGRAQVRRDLQHAKLLRAMYGRRQLKEILVDVWMNHFNVDANSSGRTQWDISPYDRIAIRPYVLGRFRDLLLANARSPAMGDYLDNRRNRVGGINENYGRELLELHTLGVDGPYTETDVVEVARCLTGWREDYTTVDGFRFQASWHDQGTKTLFGGALQIPANGGEQDGIALIDYLAEQPSTATFLARKLVRRFVNETPPTGLVAAAASTYLATGGDLRAAMETILLSPEFLHQAQNRGVKVKRPHHLMTSLARALGADPLQVGLANMRRDVEAMGEALYEAPPPTGYPDASSAWGSPGTMVLRFNQIERGAQGQDGFTFTYPIASGTAEEIVDALAPALLRGGVSEDTRDIAVAFVMLLGVPDADRVVQAATILLSSPEFLTH